MYSLVTAILNFQCPHIHVLEWQIRYDDGEKNKQKNTKIEWQISEKHRIILYTGKGVIHGRGEISEHHFLGTMLF